MYEYSDLGSYNLLLSNILENLPQLIYQYIDIWYDKDYMAILESVSCPLLPFEMTLKAQLSLLMYCHDKRLVTKSSLYVVCCKRNQKLYFFLLIALVTFCH